MALNPLKPFDIAFVGLSNGLHEFNFDLGNDFFQNFEESEIVVSELKGRLTMNKKSNMFDLDFHISGRVELECDRCLQPFWHTMDKSYSLYVKLGAQKEEQSDEVVIIPFTETHFDVSQYFFEFVMLSVPVKKVHDEEEGSLQQCDPEILKQLNKYLKKSDESQDQDDTGKPSSGRWDILKNLKFN